MSTAELLTEDRGETIVYRMLTPERAVDLYLGDITRRDYSARTIDTYRRTLYAFCDSLPPDLDVTEVKPDHIRRFWDRYNRHSRGYRASIESAVASFFAWLYYAEKIKRNPLDRIQRTRRLDPADLEVVTVSSDEVRELLEEAKASPSWTEKLAVAIPVYLGPRRRAVARLKLADYDQKQRMMRFREKGAKVIWKPCPDELADLLDRAVEEGVYKEGPDSYLVPSAAEQRRPGERDERVIWNAVRRVADRIGVETHVHALRAAFAVYYMEQNPGDLYGLQQLLGHRSIQTTLIYLRRLDKTVAMGKVRSLSWSRPQIAGITFNASPEAEKEGFEPSFPSMPATGRDCTHPPLDRPSAAPPTSLDDALTERAARSPERT